LFITRALTMALQVNCGAWPCLNWLTILNRVEAGREQSEFSWRRPLEHSSRNLMTFRKLLVSLSMLLVCAAAPAKDAPRSFSLSTSRTFSPGESVKIQLFARNVPEFKFRVYKVRDAEKFFSGLKDLHTLGEHSQSPEEQIDEHTILERIHDWKAHLWWRVPSSVLNDRISTGIGDSAKEILVPVRGDQARLGHNFRHKRHRGLWSALFSRVRAWCREGGSNLSRCCRDVSC
jgi:hypothetical protein